MMDLITVGAKIKMTETVTGEYPVGSTATIIYIDGQCFHRMVGRQTLKILR